MARNAKSNDTDESSDDEDSKMKSYITRLFKKFMKNANTRGFDKDHEQSNSSQFKNQVKGKKDARDGGQFTVPSRPKCFGCQDFSHMKQEYPTYLKTIGKSKALAAKKKSDEQYILNKPKVQQFLHIHPTNVTTFSQNIYFQLWLVTVSYFIILF